MLKALILYLGGGTYSLISTPNDRFLTNFFIAVKLRSSCNIADQNNWSNWYTNEQSNHNQTIHGFCANLMSMAVYIFTYHIHSYRITRHTFFNFKTIKYSVNIILFEYLMIQYKYLNTKWIYFVKTIGVGN